MSLSSYEVVRRAIEFDKPDRLPVQFEDLGLSDVHKVLWNQIGVGDTSLKQTIDEWGCVWTRTDVKNMGRVTGHPLASWNDLDKFLWPDPNDPAFYFGMDNLFEGSDEKYICTVLFMLLFERMHALRGFENTLVDLYLERERIELLADKIVEFDLEIINNISQRYPGQIHGIIFSDDWGTQQNLIIKTELWRGFFKPRYRQIFNAIHKAGWHAWMHTCGFVNPIIGDLIDIGLDAINLQQPKVLGISEIGNLYRGKICFVSLCDIQHTLPFKNKEEITQEADQLLKHWATPDGGFILYDYGDGEAIGVEKYKKEIMLKAFLDADPWKIRL
jgi:uroporphyrinogen decarboxylase